MLTLKNAVLSFISTTLAKLTNRKSKMTQKLPLVVILGATGSGKTKLSLDLAQRFSGEIIGADSMQIYKGLDIITAKATAEERYLVPHHLIDELHPHETCTVVEFRNKALPVIDDLLSRDKLPIVVGGTNYYIESLLWKILIEEPGKVKPIQPGVGPNDEHELSSAELHKRLLECDPVRARRLHPNDKRKILRSLEVLHQKGRRHSELLHEQQSSEGGSCLGGGLRFSNVVIFWLQCEQATLDSRLDSRVDTMLQQGLVEELLEFHTRYNEQRTSLNKLPDYTIGIFQSIGFKEFHKYLMLNPLERSCDDGKHLLQEAVDDLKRVTRRYAKKQKRWITNRFLSNSNRMVPPVYGLDTTVVSAWQEQISSPAVRIVESFIAGVPSRHPPLPMQDKKSFPNSEADTFVCEVCDRVFVGQFQWEVHLKSHKHKRVLQRKQKTANLKESLQVE